MKSVLLSVMLLLISAQSLFAAEYMRKTENGHFRIELKVSDRGLQSGANSMDIIVRDKFDKGVDSAEISLTPSMPAMGHGVWDKAVVKDRGAGKYNIKNLVFTMNGHWELKVDVKKGTLKDQAVFAFDIAQMTAGNKEYALPKGKYGRSVQYYNMPNVTLLNQDGRKVNFRDLVDSGKPVIIDFIFTTCTTICPVLSVSFTNLRKELGADADKVQLISISIDPEHDRPEQLKKYLARFKAGKGWDFLTGSRTDIDRVLRALDATIIDKMSHEPLYILRAPHSDEWVRIKGLLSKGDLLDELRRIEHR